MGLAGRKTKQRIGADPRNLSWSTDSSKFGSKYLQSLGWTSGTGLGVSGDGRTSNLKVHQKLDLMGIGANRRGPDGDDVGWRAGREFEGLLARLNQAQNADTRDIPIDEDNETDHNDGAIDHSIKGSPTTARNDEDIGHPPDPIINGKGDTGKGETAHKKRKRTVTEDEDIDAKEAKRRRKEEKREKKEQRKAAKAAKKLKLDISKSGSGDQPEVASADDIKDYAQDTETVKIVPRYRAHRARNIASKRLAAVSAIGMNEILGVSSSTCKLENSAFPFATLSPKQTTKGDESQTCAPRHNSNTSSNRPERTVSDGDVSSLGSHYASSGGLGFRSAGEGNIQESDGSDQLRTSGKSMAEYFAEKMERMRYMAPKAPAFGGANI